MILYERLGSHSLRLRDAHELENGRSYVAKSSIIDGLDFRDVDDDELHLVERMCRVRRAVLVDCVVGIAVVCREQHCVSVFYGRPYDLLYESVDGFDSLADSLVHSGVAHHVTVGEVEYDEVLLLGVYGLDEFLGNFRGAHLRLEVVGGHLR